jgi:CubicO group peptidase (beta-lactamase class C family)
VEPWLPPAMSYIRSWIEFQLRASQRPGCIVAIAHRGKVVAEYAFGHANLATGEKLTPRHRFRIASHSKSFTAAGIMKLREQGKLRLDDPVGQYVKGLHPQVAAATIAQVLSHGAGLTRDGADAGQFADRRSYLGQKELTAELRSPPAIEPNTRFKYSNHGFGLLGLVIEAITAEPYRVWIKREIVEAAGLRETEPDMPIAKGIPFARGHTLRLPLERRLVIPGDNPTHAIAPAAGFVSTAKDVARFFAQLSPATKRSVLSANSRREMIRKQWRNPHASLEGHYGLGIMSGKLADWDWFGHSGLFQGYVSRTSVIPACDITITILTNSTDGLAVFWLEGVLHILRAFAEAAPSRLDRTLVEHMGRGRSGAGRKPCHRRQSAPSQSVHGCNGNRDHRPRYRADFLGHGLCKPWPGRAPHPQQGRPRHRYLACGRQFEAGENPGGGDGAPLRPAQRAIRSLSARLTS